MSKHFFADIFPLPQPLVQILQAQAFLLISPNSHSQSNPPKSILRCLSYPSQEQAQRYQVMFTSLSNAFYLRILNTHLKHITSNNTWALIIQIESPESSLKQKLALNQQNFSHFTQQQLILILNCINLLYSRHLTQKTSLNFTFNQLIDNIFVAQNQLIKLAISSLMVPSNNNNSKQEFSKLHYHKQILQSLGMFLFQLISIQDKKSFLNFQKLFQMISQLEFRNFPLKQLKSYLLSKISDWKRSQQYFKPQQINPKTQSKDHLQYSKLQPQNRQKLSKYKLSPPSYRQTSSKQITGISLSRRLNKKITTLNEMASDKIVESFQQDEYSYILQSNNSSPSRISPHKGFPNQNYLNISQQPSLNGFSPQNPFSNSDEKFQSPMFDTETQSIRQSLSNSKNSNMQNSNLNSIIFQVQEQSNYELVESSSLKSDIVDLSFSQNDDGPEMKEMQDLQNGSKYFGEVVNGMKHGKGKIFYLDGGFYEGEWKQNTISGFGKLFYPSNKLAYAGYWKDGCFHGPGLVLNEQIEAIKEFDFTDFTNLGRYWISYRGHFNMDVREGLGIVKLSNGDSIEGNWENNCLNGEAEYKRNDGKVIKGVWRCNKLQKILKKDNDV